MKRVLLFFLMISLGACKPQQEAVKRSEQNPQSKQEEVYRATVKKSFDLVHTKLDVRFNWEKRQLYGNAAITLHPHFYPDSVVVLNARGMLINKVEDINGGQKPLNYIYRDDSLIISLGKLYNKKENATINIDYVARPEELSRIGGSAAIASDKGLYFINHDGKNPYKPRQIWTQGETQSSSVWFPTIDAPNQKMTQEIAITVDSNFVTLSNGVKVKSIDNNDGTRTDTWKQSFPHAPYLVMMAIGEFAVVKDKWRDIEVSYYLEHPYKEAARKIFGNTPEMLEFFSNILKVDYPWEKYSQVIVRDYVSGAMENTSATLHGEFMQSDERELLDFTGEEYISHELFHHWFGDLVTCESWSNIPLNESFATYGEYLWNEYKYGREEADYHLQNELSNYLRESKTKQVNLIRYDYEKQEDMFDRHSYEKGGCILHMLRKYTGDEAFFSALNLYLNRHRFNTVEVHDLRLAFEEVTGEDLNWFFDQWFFNPGHPVLDIAYDWNEENRKTEVTIRQLQPNEKVPVYKLPLEVDIYDGNTVRREKIMLASQEEVFSFATAGKPQLVNVDAEKIIAGIKTDRHSDAEWIFMFNNGRLYSDRAEALVALASDYIYPSPAADIVLKALDDKHWSIRYYALQKIEALAKDNKDVMPLLRRMALHDAKSTVRAAALRSMIQYYNSDVNDSLLAEALNDSSYAVAGTALAAITERDETKGLQLAAKLENSNSRSANELLLSIYSFYGSDKQFNYIYESVRRTSGYDRYQAAMLFGAYLKRCTAPASLINGIVLLKEMGMEETLWFTRAVAASSLIDLQSYVKSVNELNTDEINNQLKVAVEMIRLKEKDERVIKVLNGKA